MRTISLVSTKGGCGKTALSCALAVRFDAVLLDLDPQASACRWRDRRDDKEPVVTDVAPARLRPTLDALAEQGVDIVVIDTPPRSETAALEAVRVADLVVRHVTIFGHGHGLQRAIIDESQHRKPERLIMAQH